MGATRYTARFQLPDLLERGREELIVCEVYRSGQLVTPSSGTVSVYDRSGAAIVAAAAVSIVSSVAQYTIAAATLPATLPFDDGWRIEWLLTMPDGAEHRFVNDAALVRRRLYPVITDLDVQRRLRALNPDLPAVITTRASFQDDIDEADVEVQNRLIQMGRRPWLIATPSALRPTWLNTTIALVFEGLAAQNFEQFGPIAAMWREKAAKALEEATVQLDYDQDGVVEDDEARTPLAHAQVFLC